MNEQLDFGRVYRQLEALNPVRLSGRVTDVTGLVVEATGPGTPVGSQCVIESAWEGGEAIPAEVVGFRGGKLLLMALGELSGVAPGARVTLVAERPLVRVGTALLGRVIDGLSRPLDRAGPLEGGEPAPLAGRPLNPLDRPPIRDPLDLGVRAVNGLLTCGRGQRVGIFAGSGVGKSALLGMMARYTRADVNVIALIGERGREVRSFLERDLGAGLARSVVIVATADQPPLVRLRGAMLACAVADWFRDQGRDVLLLMDSLTRLAMAQREIGLSVGEPPTSRGYTPSVFALLPRLLERAGRTERGSVTGIYTVLVDGDDMNDPIADAARALLDGHIVLSRRLAGEGHFPAIDVLESLSRVMLDVTSREQQARAARVRSWLAAYREVEDLIQIGAYQRGTNAAVDEAIARRPAIAAFLRQALDEPASLEATEAALAAVTG